MRRRVEDLAISNRVNGWQLAKLEPVFERLIIDEFQLLELLIWPTREQWCPSGVV